MTNRFHLPLEHKTRETEGLPPHVPVHVETRGLLSSIGGGFQLYDLGVKIVDA